MSHCLSSYGVKNVVNPIQHVFLLFVTVRKIIFSKAKPKKAVEQTLESIE